MPVNQLQTFALGAGANVLTPAQFEALAMRNAGFASGVARSDVANTILRQTAFVARMIGQFTMHGTSEDVLDDGDVTRFEQLFYEAVRAASATTVGGGGGNGYMVAWQSPGTDQWTVPPDVTRIFAEVWGAGGGGGGSTKSTAAAQGGGGGGYACGWLEVTPGQVLDITVGAGGAGGTGSPLVNGAAGGSSSVGALITATGGAGGRSTNTVTIGNPVPGGVGVGGQFQVTGQTGGSGYVTGSLWIGGTGGGTFATSINRPRGGAGVDTFQGAFPGGGGAGSPTNAPGSVGAHGAVRIQYFL